MSKRPDSFLAFVRYMVPRFRIAQRIHRAAFRVLLSIYAGTVKAVTAAERSDNQYD